MRIPIARPYLGAEEKKAVCDVLESGWLVQGPKVAEFERLVSDLTGMKFARASTSCTTALHLALLALGIGPGDEVLVPSFTFVASANAIEYTGAKPVFIDIDLDTFNISPQEIDRYLSQNPQVKGKIRAIMPVHLFGLCADMQPIVELARMYNLHVIEDAACAIGSTHGGAHAGSMGDAGCFSFHPRKSAVTGEGGMLITNSSAVAEKVTSLRDHGAAISDFARHAKAGFFLPAFNMLGYNYRMTDLQAAIGIEQMKKLPWMIQRRMEIASRYDKALADTEWLQRPSVPKGREHTYQSYVAMVRRPHCDTISHDVVGQLHRFRNSIMKALEDKGVATRQGTHAVHALGYYKTKYGVPDDECPRSFAADRLTLALPLYPQMTDEEQDYVVQNLIAVGTDCYRSLRR